MSKEQEYKYLFTDGTDTIHINPIQVMYCYISLKEQKQIRIMMSNGSYLGYNATDENMKSYLNLIKRLNELQISTRIQTI